MHHNATNTAQHNTIQYTATQRSTTQPHSNQQFLAVGLPPLLIMAGSAEPLLGDIKMFYENCKLYGVDAIYDEAATMAHVYMTIFQGYHEQADRAMAVMASFVDAHLKQRKGENTKSDMRRSRSLGSLSSQLSNSLSNLMDLVRNPELQQQTATTTSTTTTAPTTTTSSSAATQLGNPPKRASRGSVGPLMTRTPDPGEGGRELKTFLSGIQ